jgi:ribosomal protein S18 acetylase RimI-like enzyme
MTHVELVGDDEWAVLREVRLRALATDPDAFGSTFEFEASQPEAFWRMRLRSSAWFVARNSAAVVGVVACVASAVSPEERQLDAMWVDPRWRGRGVGDDLVHAVTAYAAEARAVAVSLTVADGNDHARRLYERLGFQPTGIRAPRPRDPSSSSERLRLPLTA